VEEGRAELGLAHLQAAYPAHETDRERAGTLAAIAQAHHRLAQEEQAADVLQQALDLDVQHPAVQKAQLEITSV
jgi:hypothetical protein